MINATPVILCCGSSTRLWPVPRTGFPTQFLYLTGNESLFEQAVLQLANLGNSDTQVAPPIIVTGEDHRFFALEQLREIGVELGCTLLEPVGKNTTPALTLAALAGIECDADPVLIVTPADQTVMVNADTFASALQRAVAETTNGTIVILGVTPDKPETGYGYIQINQVQANADLNTVRRFVEKPSISSAQAYLNEDGYYWNAGMFVLKASVWLKALDQFRPDILQAMQRAWNNLSADNTFVRPGKAKFAAIPPESVDYAAIEHCSCSSCPIKMVPLDAGWSDLGAWDEVLNLLPKDEAGNAHLGNVLTTDSRNNLVHVTSHLVGVENLIVVETPDGVMVANKSCSQDVKHIVAHLKKTKREEHSRNRKVHRPWSWFDSIDEGGRSKLNASRSSPEPASACKNTITALSTRSSGLELPILPTGKRFLPLVKINPPTSPWVNFLDSPTPAQYRSKSLRLHRAAIWAKTTWSGLKTLTAEPSHEPSQQNLRQKPPRHGGHCHLQPPTVARQDRTVDFYPYRRQI